MTAAGTEAELHKNMSRMVQLFILLHVLNKEVKMYRIDKLVIHSLKNK